MSKQPNTTELRCGRRQFVTFWKVQHTGWSGGTSWFEVGRSTATRFQSKEAAETYVKAAIWHDGSSMWRLVHVCIEKSEKRTVTTETIYPATDPVWPGTPVASSAS